MSDLWSNFAATLPFSDRTIFMVGTWAAHFFTFWILNSILFYFYKHNMFPERRIWKGEMPPKELVDETMRHVLFNHFIVIPIVLYFAYDLFVSWGMEVRTPIPSAGIIARDFLVGIFFNDTLFYWGHRIAHHPALYKHVHKQHHKYNRSIGIASEYAHPLEDLLCNTLPTILGMLLMGAHMVTIWLWLIVRIAETVDTHSGYEFALSPFRALPFQGGAARHDFHHSHNQGCFGSFTTFWDSIMGTDADFLAYQAKKQVEKKAKAA